MNRVKYCLSKMQEIINNPRQQNLIDLDLLIDYTKVMYSELQDLRLNLESNHSISEQIKGVKQENTEEQKNQEALFPDSKKSQGIFPAEELELPQPNPKSANEEIKQDPPLINKTADNLNGQKEKDNEIPKINLWESTIPEESKAEKEVVAPELQALGINFEEPEGVRDISKPLKEARDLRKLITLNDKFAYVIELFAGENDAYENTINTMNAIPSYGETMEWIIANLQNKYNWDVENELVHSFYDVVKDRFEK